MKQAIFMIQGAFWQRHQWLDIACVPVEGNIAVIKTAVVEFMFQGAVSAGPASLLGEMSGSMTDHFGRSRITGFVREPSRLSFKKQYDDKSYQIAYIFPAIDKGVVWEGFYQGPPNVGCGLARSVLTEVPVEFFDPSTLLATMEKFCPNLRQAET